MSFDSRLVSAAPEHIYPFGGILREFGAELMDPTRAAAAGINYLFRLYPAFYYQRPVTPHIIVETGPTTDELLAYYNHGLYCHSAASVVVKIDDATIDSSVIYCRKGARCSILYETYRAEDRSAVVLSAIAMAPDPPKAEFQREDRAYLYIGSAGSANYGHWLVDDLPRAKAWIELHRRGGGTRCVVVLPRVDPAMDNVRVQSLRSLIDERIEVIFIEPFTAIRFKNLYYATPVSRHPHVKNPAAIDFVRSSAIRAIRPGGEEVSRLFVARRPPNRRAIVNFDEVCGFLERRGFSLVEPERLDFESQVRLFAGAQVIVGQMGASMTNSLFCRPGTTLIYLAPAGWEEPFYLDLATAGGQQYHVHVGPPISDGEPYLSDFNLPLEQLGHRLRWMGIDE